MSKAEKFIQDYTRNCSNIIGAGFKGSKYTQLYESWLTPDQARRAVEIAREEIYEWLDNNLSAYDACDSSIEKVRLLKDLKELK